MTVTSEQVKNAMKAANITRVDHHRCGICNFMVFYSRHEDLLFFNSGCNCSWSPARPSSWDDAADWINMQSNETIKNDLMKRFGFGIEPPPPPPFKREPRLNALDEAKEEPFDGAQPLYASPISSAAIRNAAQSVVDTYDAYRKRGVMPAPSEYQAVVEAINGLRTALQSTPHKEDKG